MKRLMLLLMLSAPLASMAQVDDVYFVPKKEKSSFAAKSSDESFFVDVEEDSPYFEEQSTWTWADMESFTDVEIYNCRNLERLPLELLTTLPELQSLNIACNNNISGAQLKSDWEAIIDGASGPRLQLLYMGYNNLEEFPDYEHLSKMVKLALLDCTNNKIKKLHPFGKNINLTKRFF